MRLLNFLFSCTDVSCPDAGDVNDDGARNISDAVAGLQYLFGGARAPPAPGPMSCGIDPTFDALAPCPQETCDLEGG